jgi:hypothetical protein
VHGGLRGRAKRAARPGRYAFFVPFFPAAIAARLRAFLAFSVR